MSRELGTMRDYEFRLLGEGNVEVQTEMHLSEGSAIRAGRKSANGKRFEVWRGSKRVWPRVRQSH